MPRKTNLHAKSGNNRRTQAQSSQPNMVFAGRLVEDRDAVASKPLPVRNEAARQGREIVALRYFKIKKGTYPQFYKESAEGVWPYFEKIGARIVGQWKVIHPDRDGTLVGVDSPDFDEVYLLTRYASVDHWAATRDMATLGGNGPDWERCNQALAFRASVTLDTGVIFLEGHLAANIPYFMPGLNEHYELVRDEE